MSHRLMNCSDMWGRGNWAMVPRVVLRSLMTLASTSENIYKEISTSEKYLPFQARCKVENWVSDTGRPWQKALCLYSSWPSQTSTKWIDRSDESLWLSIIVSNMWGVDKKDCIIPFCILSNAFIRTSGWIFKIQSFSILGPSPSPRPYRRQATFSEPFRWPDAYQIIHMVE